MENNNQTPPEGEPAPESGKSPKFNFYWIYGLLALYLLGSLLFVNVGHDAKEVGGTQFDKIIKSGDVKEILVVNKAVVELTLKPEALKKNDSLYKKVAKNPFGYANPGPHFSKSIGTVEKLEERLEKFNFKF